MSGGIAEFMPKNIDKLKINSPPIVPGDKISLNSNDLTAGKRIQETTKQKMAASAIVGRRIESISAIEIFDSRMNPTVKVTLSLAGGEKATAEVPSGASTGEREALEMRDGRCY